MTSAEADARIDEAKMIAAWLEHKSQELLKIANDQNRNYGRDQQVLAISKAINLQELAMHIRGAQHWRDFHDGKFTA